MRRKSWFCAVALFVTLNLFCRLVYGEEKNFIQPCLDDGGYRTWLKEPDGSYINHLGHDYNAPAGTEIKAIADGIVSEIRLDVEGFGSEDTKGPLVWIKHRLSNGKFFHALYGHIQPVKILKKGDSIKVGQIIGTIIEYLHKKTKKDISHLHFGIWNDENLPPRGTLLGYGPVNKFTNPIEFLQKNKPYKDERPPQDKGIPGGVVFTDGKQIIYYDFATREQTNLIVDLPGAGTFAVKTAAISEDGILLVFLDGANKFWARVLPQDKPYSIPVQEMFEHRNVQKSIRLTPLGDNIRNLRVSQRGREIAYESVKKDTALIEVPGDSETHLRRVSRRFPLYFRDPEDQEERKNTSAYIPIIDNYNAVTAIYISPKRSDMHGWMFHFGNVAFYPAKTQYLDVDPNGQEGLAVNRGMQTRPGGPYYPLTLVPVGGYKCNVTIEEAQKCFSIKRNAHFPAWHRERQWLAVVYQTDDGWGPIEIRNCDVDGTGFGAPNEFQLQKGELWCKPSRWYLSGSLRNCEGLAWKPDGSITYLEEGNLFLIDGNQITRGIQNSTLSWFGEFSITGIFPKGHFFPVIPTLITQGIRGNNLFWVSNDAFIFRGQDRALYVWNQGRGEKLLDFVPEEFSYCQPSPFAVTSGKNKVLIDDIVTTFYVGPIELNYANTTTLYDPCYANVHTGNTATIFEEMEYAYADETNIEDIKDPSRYLYNEVGIKKLKRPSLGSLTIAKVQPNQILLVRDSYKYAAIRIIEVERKNWQEVDPLIRKSWKDEISEGLLCPFLKSVTYEWKYWPVYPTGLAKASSLTRE